jgi:hypothetical protein
MLDSLSAYLSEFQLQAQYDPIMYNNMEESDDTEALINEEEIPELLAELGLTALTMLENNEHQ